MSTDVVKNGTPKPHYRRVVTTHEKGKSVVSSDEEIETYEFKSVPGYRHTLIWVNPSIPDLSREQRFDTYPDSVVPGPGGTSLHYVTFPSGAVFSSPSFDGEAARRESLARLRGLANHFERDDPGMHKTNTVDYAVVFEGKYGLSWMTEKPFISKRAMSSSRMGPGTRGGIKARSR